MSRQRGRLPSATERYPSSDSPRGERVLPLWPQEHPLLSGTIRDNIVYGVERKVTEEELIHVAKMANIYDFVMSTPGGFDAEVGPGGSNFSGGQQQCICHSQSHDAQPGLSAAG